jgi:hypothetical protein
MAVTAHPSRAARGIVQLTSLVERARQSLRRRQKPLLLLAIFAVVVGCGLSLDSLDLRWSDVRLAPLLTIAAIIVPLTIAYSALNMVVMAKAAKVRMSFWEGVRVTAYAQVAELLPIPGGAMVRTAALMKAGGKAGQSAELVIAFSLLWVACAACGAGIALRDNSWPLLILGGGGAAAVMATVVWIGFRFGAVLAAVALILRILGLALTAWRLATSFAVIGVTVSFVSSFTFAFSTIAGSASSIAPGGLGIGESLAAILAEPAGVASSAAFLATALSRLTGVVVCMLFALGSLALQRQPQESPAHG